MKMYTNFLNNRVVEQNLSLITGSNCTVFGYVRTIPGNLQESYKRLNFISACIIYM